MIGPGAMFAFPSGLCHNALAMAAPFAERVEMRPATAADVPGIARIMNYPPEPPMAVLLGSARASRLAELFVLSGASIAPESTTVAILDRAVVGVLDWTSQSCTAAVRASWLYGGGEEKKRGLRTNDGEPRPRPDVEGHLGYAGAQCPKNQPRTRTLRSLSVTQSPAAR